MAIPVVGLQGYGTGVAMAIPVVGLFARGEQKTKLAHLSRVILVKPGVVGAGGGASTERLTFALAPDSFCELDEIFPINSAIPSEPAIAFVLWKTGSRREDWCEKEETSQQEGHRHTCELDGQENCYKFKRTSGFTILQISIYDE